MSKAKIYYRDIGDYLNRDEKLALIKKYGSVSNIEMNWEILTPDEHGDWISLRNDLFETFIALEPDKKFNHISNTYFTLNSMGVGTSRDAWVYNSSKKVVEANMKSMVSFYNSQVDDFFSAKKKKSSIDINDFIETDTKKISWSSSLIPKVVSGDKAVFEPKKIYIASYRPFFKQYLYYGDKMIHRRGQTDYLFPNPFESQNLIICIPGIGVTKDFSIVITDIIPDLEIIGKSQCFPLYYYDQRQKEHSNLFDKGDDSEFVRRDGISDFILDRAKKQYGKTVTKEDIFYYVYGFLHSPEYRIKFANDLKKMLPRIPLVDEPKDFWKFSKAGRALAELHINYESVPPAPGVIVLYDKIPKSSINKAMKGKELDTINYRVEKMRFPSKEDKSTIIYNHQISITNIPLRAYEYVVNGKSAIEWIMERYQVTTHKESGIKNDPNDWAEEVGNPKYILNLLLSIINLSLQTIDIVEGLPQLKFE